MKNEKTNKLREQKNQKERNVRLEKASALIQMHPDKKDLFAIYYGENIIASTYDGIIDFNPNGYNDIVGAERFTYDDYIDVQIRSFHKTRGWFATCFYNIPLGFKGCIERRAKDNVCFKRIMVDGMYPDGICFEGKEEHVWMSVEGFEKYQIGDCVSFFAEVYRYVKTSNGKQIDFGLRNPKSVKKIESYELPTDDDLIKQEINEIICETCYLREQCNSVSCLLPKNCVKEQRNQMFKAVKYAKKQK